MQSWKVGVSASVLSDKKRSNRLDGIGIYTKNLVDGLKKLSIQVAPITYTPLFNKNRKNNPILLDGMAFPYPDYVEIVSSLVLPRWTKTIENELSLYHATDFSVPRLKSTPVVTTLHDALLLKRTQGFDVPINKLDQWLIKRQVRYAQRYIAISKSVVPELVEYWKVDQNKIDVVYNGIPDFWFSTISNEKKRSVLNKFQIKNNYILFVSSLRPRKNLLRVIQAYKSLPEDLKQCYSLIVVGQMTGASDNKAIIADLARLQDLGQGKWLNYVTIDELQALYQSASLFMFPSLAEGFGYPIVEAFASGVPVITSNYGAMAEIAGDAGYLINPYDVENIADAMQMLLCDNLMSSQFVERGRARAHRFTLKKMIEETLGVYQKLF